MGRVRKVLFAAIVALIAPSAFGVDGAASSEDFEELFCVPQCLDRSITGMCTDYGPDFCTPYPETACIPHCVRRSITGMCTSYGRDFCGVEPYCQPYCEDRSTTGMCLRYGADACVGYY